MMKDVADNGHIKACFQYAMRMRKIAISEDDYKESFKYMKMAAEKDYPEAIYLLAKMYDFGIGTKINYVEARFWYEKCHNYLYSNAASGYVGRHYLYGLGGLEINAKKAAELFEIAVKQTSRCPSEILYEYARCYELGLGVDVDFEKANDLRKQAIINSQTIR